MTIIESVRIQKPKFITKFDVSLKSSILSEKIQQSDGKTHRDHDRNKSTLFNFDLRRQSHETDIRLDKKFICLLDSNVDLRKLEST